MSKQYFNWQVVFVNTNKLAIKFKQSFDQYGNVPVELEYVKKCLAIMVLKKGKLIGGEILNIGKHPFRYFEIFKNEKEKNAILLNEGLLGSSMMEISSIFHIKNLSSTDRVAFFLITCWEAFQYAKQNNILFIIGGSLIKKVQDKQMEVMRKLILVMPFDTQLIHSTGETSGVAKIYGTKTKHFFKNVLFVVIKEIISLLFKGLVKVLKKVRF